MPKWMRISFISIIMLASLLVLISCGGGDKMEATRTNPLDLVTGETGSGAGGFGGGGGGGGGGACVAGPVCVDTIAYPQLTQSACQSGGGTWHAGQTCAQLGF